MPLPDWMLPAVLTAAGNAADTATSIHALNHTPGAVEANPIFGNNKAAIVALKAAGTVPQILAERWLANRGHPTAAKVVGAAIGGLGGAMALRNLQQGK